MGNINKELALLTRTVYYGENINEFLEHISLMITINNFMEKLASSFLTRMTEGKYSKILERKNLVSALLKKVCMNFLRTQL